MRAGSKVNINSNGEGPEAAADTGKTYSSAFNSQFFKHLADQSYYYSIMAAGAKKTKGERNP
jgi:hypothetical protein